MKKHKKNCSLGNGGSLTDWKYATGVITIVASLGQARLSGLNEDEAHSYTMGELDRLGLLNEICLR